MGIDKTILYLGGGTMSGVFGAVVVTGLEVADAYDKIEAIYSCFAGAFNDAYFLARDSELGSSIYREDLTDGRFLNIKRYFKANLME